MYNTPDYVVKIGPIEGEKTVYFRKIILWERGKGVGRKLKTLGS